MFESELVRLYKEISVARIEIERLKFENRRLIQLSTIKIQQLSKTINTLDTNYEKLKKDFEKWILANE